MCLAVLLPTSYVNMQTQYQMKRLIHLKEVYQRIIRDPSILRANPITLDTKIQRLSVKLLRHATLDLKGDEKFEKMEDLAYKVYEGLADAIDEIEKDAELNPRTFLGFALYPDSLWSVLSFMLAIAFGMVQQKLQPAEG